VHAGKLRQVTLLVGGTAQHCVDQYGFVSLLLARGQHCYAWRTTC